MITLDEYLSTYEGVDEFARIWIIKCIVYALDFIHKKGIMHRSLCENVVLIENVENCPKVLLTDFGITKY